MVRELEYVTCEGIPWEPFVALFTLEKRCLGGTGYQPSGMYKDGYQEDGASLFMEMHSGKTRDSGHKLKWKWNTLKNSYCKGDC